MIFKKNLILLSAILSAAKADCFDGNNFGCSHFCSGSICSCPPCWVLGDDGKTCRFEAGKAQVVCSANGAEVTIDKCAVPDVDPAKIHLKDTACSATEENENTWKVVTGFSDCGSEFSFSEEKLTLQNTLMIGPSIVAGRKQSRNYKIVFSCSYNDDLQASSTIRANDVLFEGVRFDINDAQPIDFSFGFALDFYKSKEFTTLASDGQFQPGSPLFVKVAPTSALSEALEFSVNKCTVKDEVISQSADILNTCPVTGTNFEFLPGQKDRSAVKFTYKSFIFAASETTAEINLSCDIKLCPQNSVECLKVCDGAEINPVIPVFILMIFADLSKSYITNRDGSETSAVQINAPSNDYSSEAQSAVVQGKLHLFGGAIDKKRIARLDACTLVELSYKLSVDYISGHDALSISDNSEALICFDYGTWKSCEKFTGSSVVQAYSTSFTHRLGGLGFYNGQPITVGSYGYSDGYRKVETLSSTGWTTLADSPMNYDTHILIGLGNDLIMIGGRDTVGDIKSDVWRLSDNSWSQEADLKQKLMFGSAIATGHSIFIVGGYDPNYGSYSQRIDLDTDEEISGIEQIGVHDGYDYFPALFVTSQDYCVSD